jgi:hypothetical protein
MMERVRRLLKINPGEGRTAARYLAFMVVVWTGFAVGGTGVEALLFARVGPRALPYLYIALGLVTFLSMSGLSLILRRREPRRFLLFLPALFASVVLLMRTLVETGADFVYPVLWLLMMVMWTVQGMAARVTEQKSASLCFNLAAYIRELGYHGTVRPVDSLRAAVAAGLGVVGSDGNLSVPGHGSKVYVGDAVLTDLPLAPGSPEV